MNGTGSKGGQAHEGRQEPGRNDVRLPFRAHRLTLMKLRDVAGLRGNATLLRNGAAVHEWSAGEVRYKRVPVHAAGAKTRRR